MYIPKTEFQDGNSGAGNQAWGLRNVGFVGTCRLCTHGAGPDRVSGPGCARVSSASPLSTGGPAGSAGGPGAALGQQSVEVTCADPFLPSGSGSTDGREPHAPSFLCPPSSGLCPPLLGGDLSALGISRLTGVSLFAWGLSHMGQSEQCTLWWAWVPQHQPDLWGSWRLKPPHVSVANPR